MQPLKARMVLFGALAALACHGDPTGNEGTPTSIVAQPEVVFVAQGTTQPVIVTVVDEDGQALQADFTASNIGPGITVQFDSTFLEVNSDNPIRRQARFLVTAVDLAASSFVVNALGLSKTVEVTSVPAVLNATISNTTPALGDTISITAAPGTFFNPTSVLTFEGAAPVVVSQDASTIVFIPFPNIANLPAVVSDVGVASNPNLTFTLATSQTVTTDSIPNIGANVTPLTPALGATVTLTLPVELRVIPESLPGLTVANAAVPPRDIAVSADSLTITFVPPPNADSFVVVPGIIAQRLPMYPLQLATTAKVTTPVVDSIPATLSSTTPAANQSVTLTRTDASFSFNADATVLVGADATPVVFTVAGDSSSITFLPTPSSSGNVSVDGVTIAGFSLTLPAKAPSITVGALAAAAGTDDPGTAPSLPVPGSGQASAFWDVPDFVATVDHFYKLVVPAGTFNVTVDWDVGSDIDFVICGGTCADPFGADLIGTPTTDPGVGGFQGATSAHPETGTLTLAAGTYWVLVEDFGGDAAGATVQIILRRTS